MISKSNTKSIANSRLNKFRKNQSRKRNMRGGVKWFQNLFVKKEIHPDIMKIKDILESFKHVEELGLNKINLLKHAAELFNKGITPEKVEANLKDAELRYT